ncbi:hypothetical protein [Blastococcus sp. LR1]|uniref:hypothetical protein n=1 Tax=Blastococcus sp. LR1 TaxID=2877000 RepID=UPI001CC95B2F|nr:hypothetical protein [Blastococcus sp. LR1]MCA0146951.1 hypothetical protein [Blastococcus sp. LR1]
MRKSRVLLAGVAVAAAGLTTSAFTASNTITVDNNVAGYGELTTSGVTVTNIAYAPTAADGARLQSVAFTVTEDLTGMSSRMTLYGLGGSPTPISNGASTCSYVAANNLVTCTLTTPPLITSFDKTSLTVTSN